MHLNVRMLCDFPMPDISLQSPPEILFGEAHLDVCIQFNIFNAEFIIFNAEFIIFKAVFKAEFIIFNAKFIIFNAEFIDFNANRYLIELLLLVFGKSLHHHPKLFDFIVH